MEQLAVIHRYTHPEGWWVIPGHQLGYHVRTERNRATGTHTDHARALVVTVSNIQGCHGYYSHTYHLFTPYAFGAWDNLVSQYEWGIFCYPSNAYITLENSEITIAKGVHLYATCPLTLKPCRSCRNKADGYKTRGGPVPYQDIVLFHQRGN